MWTEYYDWIWNCSIHNFNNANLRETDIESSLKFAQAMDDVMDVRWFSDEARFYTLTGKTAHTEEVTSQMSM